ncbi:MAG: EamA family transporter [Pseudomonadota bacterium]
MEILWIPIAMGAGLMQAVRTAAQKALNAHLGTWMVTYVRSLYGLPVMLIYLGLVLYFEGRGLPDFSAEYLFHCAMTALTQVIATYLLIQLFTMSNFAVGTMLTKTDIMQAAIIGTVLFSETISALGWVAITLSVLGVILMSAGRAKGLLGRGLMAAVFSKATMIGLASAFLFCLSYLFLREAALTLPEGSTFYRGAWSVVMVTSMQVVCLGLWLVWKKNPEFVKLPGLFRPSAFT